MFRISESMITDLNVCFFNLNCESLDTYVYVCICVCMCMYNRQTDRQTPIEI